MPQHLAFTPDVLFPAALKSYALLFDKVAVLWIKKLWEPGVEIAQELQAEIPEWEYLYDRHFLIDPEGLVGSASIDKLAALGELLSRTPRARDHWRVVEFLACRAFAGQYRESSGNDAVSFTVCRHRQSTELLKPGKDSVVSVVLQKLPVPNELTPWEAIFDFRSDPESMIKYNRLRRWMSRLARTDQRAHEIEEEISTLLHDYQQHMKAHRINAGYGLMEVLLTAGAEFLESLVKVKWSSAARSLFKVRHRRASLLQAELAAPGREIAYVALAAEKFSHRGK